MARADQQLVRARIVIEQPVAGVLHSLQQDDRPLDPKRSTSGEALAFDFTMRAAPGKPPVAWRWFGPQIRAEGKERQFVYIRIGTAAGDCASEWTRRMKIDIHDIDPALVERGIDGAVLVGTVCGTAKDGSPVCATVKPVVWEVT